MKLTLLTLGVILGAVVAAPTEPKADELKGFSLEEVVPNQFGQRGFSGTWLTGNELLYRNAVGNYARLNVEDKTESVLLDPKDLEAKWPGASVQFVKPNFDKVLIRYAVRTVFRHSTLSKYAILDLVTR